METAGMQNAIVNTTALTFILNIDELLYATITTPKTRYMVEQLQPFTFHEHETDPSKPRQRNTWMSCIVDLFANKFPTRLFLVTLVWMICLADYYRSHCIRSQDGTWYSMPMYLPL